MGFLKDIIGLADDIVSIPTDFIGLTNHHDKKEALRKAKIAFMNDEISAEEYRKIKTLLEE